ncbi:MAG: hypothetical protein LBR39_07310 [Coriobacteriales bacterium]|nr:hypothetical protein [Coriobacteriales bacterium]
MSDTEKKGVFKSLGNINPMVLVVICAILLIPPPIILLSSMGPSQSSLVGSYRIVSVEQLSVTYTVETLGDIGYTSDDFVLTISADNTFHLMLYGTDSVGTYSIDGNQVVFKSPDRGGRFNGTKHGSSLELKISGATYTFKK